MDAFCGKWKLQETDGNMMKFYEAIGHTDKQHIEKFEKMNDVANNVVEDCSIDGNHVVIVSYLGDKEVLRLDCELDKELTITSKISGKTYTLKTSFSNGQLITTQKGEGCDASYTRTVAGGVKTLKAKAGSVEAVRKYKKI